MLLPGGTNVARDARTGDTIDLTGSGQAEPGDHSAAGGGTFVHRHANGDLVANGVYVVIRFISWEKDTGTLPVADGIGHADQASSGILRMRIRAFPQGGTPVEATLTVFCHLPGASKPTTEGVRVQVGSFNFVQTSGVTLFHVFS